MSTPYVCCAYSYMRSYGDAVLCFSISLQGGGQPLYYTIYCLFDCYVWNIHKH